MKCTVYSVFNFLFLSLVYGSAFAATNKAKEHFLVGLVQPLRMSFGFLTSLVIFIIRYFVHPGFKESVKDHLRFSPMTYVHVAIGGLLNLGIPHFLLVIAQQWLPTSHVQLIQPIAQSAGAVFGHFVLPDEPFTWYKAIALVLALVGTAVCSIPSFTTTPAGVTSSEMTLGIFLVLLSMCMFGVAPVYFKWKTTNMDVTISSMFQTLASAIFGFIWVLISDGPKSVGQNLVNNDFTGYRWTLLIGVLSSGLGVHAFMILINQIGAFGSNFIIFGQMITGLLIGILILGEWNSYSWWEIFLSILGIVLMLASITVGIIETPPEEDTTQPEQVMDVDDAEIESSNRLNEL